MTDDDTDGGPAIELSLKAREKCYRMISEYELRQIARRTLDGDEDRIQHRHDPKTGESLNEFHVRRGKYSVVVKWDEYGDSRESDEEVLVVVTQMHAHADYADRDEWHHVHELPSADEVAA